MTRRKGAANMLQLPTGGADRFAADLHIGLGGRATTFFQIAWQTSCGDIFPAGYAAQSARDHMIEGQIMSAAAINAFKFVAKK